MRRYPAILVKRAASVTLVARLARDFMRPHAKRIALAFLLMGLAAASTALRAWLMQPVLDNIFLARDGSLLLLLAGGALALAVVKGLSDYGDAVLMTRVGQRIIADVQKALFARLMRADLAYFHAHPTGTLISRFTSDAVLLRGAAANVLGGMGKDAVTVAFLIAVMFYQDWLLGLVSFFVFPLAIHPIVGIGRRIRRVAANTQAEIGQLTTLLSQTFQGARHVKAYGMEAYEERRADDGGSRWRRNCCRHPLRWSSGHRRHSHPGRPLLVHHGAAARLSAVEESRKSELIAAGGSRSRRTDLRGARHRTDDPRQARREALAHRRRRDPLRFGALWVRLQRRRTRRSLAGGPGGLHGRPRRALGSGEIYHSQPDPAVF